MGFVYYNPNPDKNLVGDCVIRAISKVTNQSWSDVYIGICVQGYIDKDMPSSNAVWGNYLKECGFRRRIIPNTCPDCYTVKQFCKDHSYGVYLLATGTHVIAIENGNYFDTWDSGDEVPIYFWQEVLNEYV